MIVEWLVDGRFILVVGDMMRCTECSGAIGQEPVERGYDTHDPKNLKMFTS